MPKITYLNPICSRYFLRLLKLKPPSRILSPLSLSLFSVCVTVTGSLFESSEVDLIFRSSTLRSLVFSDPSMDSGTQSQLRFYPRSSFPSCITRSFGVSLNPRFHWTSCGGFAFSSGFERRGVFMFWIRLVAEKLRENKGKKLKP